MSDLDYSSSIVNLDAKVSPAILAGILGINVSTMYQDAQIGRLPLKLTDSTYRECIQMYLAHYKKSVDVKLAKEQNEKELKKLKLEEDIKLKELKVKAQAEAAASKKKSFTMSDSGDDSMSPLMAAKLRQDIRLGLAKEAQLWLKIAIERQDYIAVNELISLCEPFVQAIKTSLTTLSADVPEAKVYVNQALESLYSLGVKMIDKALLDKDDYVQKMLDKELDLDAIEVDFTSDRVEL